MQSLYLEALKRTLTSTEKGHPFMSVFTNNLPVKIKIAWIDPNGERRAEHTLPPLVSTPVGNAVKGYYYFVTEAVTGAFICVTSAERANKSVSIDEELFTEPNALGSPPKADPGSPIPEPYLPVVVGIGTDANNNCFLRTQQYIRTGDLYGLSPGAKKTITKRSGSKEKTSPERMKTINGKLGIDPGAGLDLVAALISNSLNKMSRHSQEFTINRQFTNNVSLTFSNPSNAQSCIYALWKLVDTVTYINVAENSIIFRVSDDYTPLIPVLYPGG